MKWAGPLFPTLNASLAPALASFSSCLDLENLRMEEAISIFQLSLDHGKGGGVCATLGTAAESSGSRMRSQRRSKGKKERASQGKGRRLWKKWAQSPAIIPFRWKNKNLEGNFKQRETDCSTFQSAYPATGEFTWERVTLEPRLPASEVWHPFLSPAP